MLLLERVDVVAASAVTLTTAGYEPTGTDPQTQLDELLATEIPRRSTDPVDIERRELMDALGLSHA